MNVDNTRQIIKSFIASVAGRCACSTNLQTNFANYSIVGDKYNRLISKINTSYPLLSECNKTFINGESVVNTIMEIYSKER